jgi:D-alanyl-D-alanine endopeptidase (penicillin-binding protein 7)
LSRIPTSTNKLRVQLAPWVLVLSVLVALPLGALADVRPASEPVVVKKKASVSVHRVRATARGASQRPSLGELYGLHGDADSLALKSSVALVLDQNTNEVLFSKNPQVVLPIASITKLMTALVVSDSNQPLDEVLSISAEDVDIEKGSGSRLKVGTRLPREDMLHLALMASENRAANALGRHYPGGRPAFVAAMNEKARELGMNDTQFVEPTGLSSSNRSSANDLAMLVREVEQHTLIRQLSTSRDHDVKIGTRKVRFRNTNGLVRGGTWDIGVQKTGYISEAGRCLVMQAQLSGRNLIMVLLDSAGKYSRIADAERIRKWVSALPATPVLPSVPAEQVEHAEPEARPLPGLEADAGGPLDREVQTL